MMQPAWWKRWLFLCWLAWAVSPAHAEDVYYFSVLNQRSPTLTAQYWNPILAHVSRKSGVGLKLVMGKTAPDTLALTVRGEAQFAYTNALFASEYAKLGWKVIARPNTDGIRAEIVTTEGSNIQRIEDMAGREIAFSSADSFEYKLPMDMLARKRISIAASFAGNQEGAIAQLKAGRVLVAGTAEDVMTAYGRREKFRYHVLWRSETYFDLPVMAGPAVSAEVARAVQYALVGMLRDAEGRRILEAGAALLKAPATVGFVAANDRDYEDYRAFYRNALVRN